MSSTPKNTYGLACGSSGWSPPGTPLASITKPLPDGPGSIVQPNTPV
jgi:hypothetical protein